MLNLSVKLDLSILELRYAKKSFDGFKFSGQDIQSFSIYCLLEKITSSRNQVSFHFGPIITGARTFLWEEGMGACPSMSSYTVNYGSGILSFGACFLQE